MPWLLASPGAGHQHPWYWPCRISSSLLHEERVQTKQVLSMWRNDIKYKYMFMLPLINLACKRLMYISHIYAQCSASYQSQTCQRMITYICIRPDKWLSCIVYESVNYTFVYLCTEKRQVFLFLLLQMLLKTSLSIVIHALTSSGVFHWHDWGRLTSVMLKLF